MRLLLADDHELFAELVQAALQREDPGTIVETVGDYAGAEARVRAMLGGSQPVIDILLLDVQMPGMNGLSGLRRMRMLAPDLPVAIISGTITPVEARGFIAEGATGFIPKTMGVRELSSAIAVMVDGDRFLPPFLMLTAEVSQALGPTPKASDAFSELTPRETDLLWQVAEGWSNKQIARNLKLAEPTVKTHLTNLYRKIGARSRTDAARMAFSAMGDGSGRTQPA